MDPERRIDPEYLRRHQYADSRNLDARFQLHNRFSTDPQGWHEWVFEHLDLCARPRLFEIGCGQAFFWQKNARRLPAAWQPVLSDLSPGMLRDARQALEPLGLAPTYLAADARCFPWRDDTFDVVMANHMLYHVPDRPRALAEIRRVLRPGGRLYAATNGGAHLRELFKVMGAVLPDVVARDTGSAGQLGFSLESGAAQLEEHFGSVRLHRYQDGLAVTDPEAVVAFVRSAHTVTAEQEQALRREVEARTDGDGVFHIAKEAGLFIAQD